MTQGSLMVQLNATYRSIEESLGRLLPEQTKEQLSLLEGLARFGLSSPPCFLFCLKCVRSTFITVRAPQ